MQETLFFEADGLRLHGTLHLPQTPKPPFVIGVHGMLSNGDSPKQQDLARQCNRMGIAYFRFDHRGCGRSDGVFAEVTTFEGRCRDLAAAMAMLGRRPDLGRSAGLFGSSLGGAVVLHAARETDFNAVVTLAAPIRFSAIHIPEDYQTDPDLAGIRRDQLTYDLTENLANVHHLLVCHGDADPVVPYENALQIHDAAGTPKKLLCLPGGDHPLSQPEHQQTFMENTLKWFDRHLVSKTG